MRKVLDEFYAAVRELEERLKEEREKNATLYDDDAEFRIELNRDRMRQGLSPYTENPFRDAGDDRRAHLRIVR